jgi:hypothetical protein
MSSTLPQETDLEICRVLTGWDALERRLKGPAIIDFNLPGFSDPAANDRYANRLEVLKDLVRLQKDPEVRANPPVARKLRAQEAFLRNVMGEHWDFHEYVEATQGFTPRQFTEQELDAQWKDTERALAAVGVAADADLIKNLAAVDGKIAEDSIGGFYQEIAARNAAVLTPVIGAIPPFSFKVEFDDVDAYWSNWVDGQKTDYRLRFNRHNVKEHFNGKSTLLAFHEISSHLVQAALLNRRIAEGQAPLCLGLTTVHDSDQFQSEGLAQSLTYFLDTPDSQNPFMIARRELTLYRDMVHNNLHIMINTGSRIGECVDYGVEHMPFESQANIAHSLASKANNPQFRNYEHVYGASAVFFKKMAERATPAQKEIILNRVYNEWLSPAELATFAYGLPAPQSAAPSRIQPGSPQP